jgi:excisionase family DNA binding protein
MDEQRVIPLEIPYLNTAITAGHEAERKASKPRTFSRNKIESEVTQAAENLIFEMRFEREWLSTQEAAHFLSVSENALRIMVHRDQVPVFKLGRRLRFRLSDCRALFERKGV